MNQTVVAEQEDTRSTEEILRGARDPDKGPLYFVPLDAKPLCHPAPDYMVKYFDELREINPWVQSIAAYIDARNCAQVTVTFDAAVEGGALETCYGYAQCRVANLYDDLRLLRQSYPEA